MIRILQLLLAVLIIVVLLYGAAVVGIGGNLGLSFGYFGKLNLVRAEILSIPGLDIIGQSLHKDVTLEDFALDVTNGTNTVTLWFNTEQGRKTWEKFHQPGTALNIRWGGAEGKSRRSFALGTDSALSLACERPIENLADVLGSLDAILEHVGDPELSRQADASQEKVRVRLNFDG